MNFVLLFLTIFLLSPLQAKNSLSPSKPISDSIQIQTSNPFPNASLPPGSPKQVPAAIEAGYSVPIPYYGTDFFRDLKSVNKDSLDFKTRIRQILQGGHIKSANSADTLVDQCNARASNCYQHRAIGYQSARVFLLGSFYLVEHGDSGYGVREVYCQKVYVKADFKGGEAPGPNVVPNNNVLNVEHTWPQSRFNSKFDKETQKSDLHHLFPTDSKLNSIRGNFKFGEVAQDKTPLPCPSGARFGFPSRQLAGELVFEPPQIHKGNVARAIFYFSIKYNSPIDPYEEATLKQWNHEDAVDAEEKDRNEKIFKLQGSRNPFVDFPELADRVSDF